MRSGVDIEGIDKVSKTLALLPKKYFDKNTRGHILGDASIPVIAAVRNKTPLGKKAKHNSLDGIKRKGTLKRSVQAFKSRKDKENMSVLVGNVLNKRAKISSAKGAPRLSKAKSKRAYYASILLAKNKKTWTPFGGRRGQRTKNAYDFIRQGYAVSKTAAAQRIIKQSNKIIKRYKSRFGM